MALNFDLLGDPIPENWGRRGRPQHVPTQENRSKIRLLLGFGWTAERIARALRVSKPTLRKHYFAELRHADEARDALKAAHLMMVYRQADAGNVGAIKELGRLIERDELERIPQRRRAEEPKPEKLGKKEAADLAARSAHEGTEWGALLN
jgi:hypothetical protein